MYLNVNCSWWRLGTGTGLGKICRGLVMDNIEC